MNTLKTTFNEEKIRDHFRPQREALDAAVLSWIDTTDTLPDGMDADAEKAAGAIVDAYAARHFPKTTYAVDKDSVKPEPDKGFGTYVRVALIGDVPALVKFMSKPAGFGAPPPRTPFEVVAGGNLVRFQIAAPQDTDTLRIHIETGLGHVTHHLGILNEEIEEVRRTTMAFAGMRARRHIETLRQRSVTAAAWAGLGSTP